MAGFDSILGRRTRWFAVVAMVLVVILLVAALVGAILAALVPTLSAHLPPPVPSPADGAGSLVGGAFLLFLLLIPFYLIGFGLLLCCCCKGFVPAPSFPLLLGLPDLSKLAAILRAVATELEHLATSIDTANATVKDARDKLTNDFLSIKKPVVRTHGQTFETPFGSQTVTVLDGIEWEPVFDDDIKSKLNALTTNLADDASGQTVLGKASAAMRDQATLLKQKASVLDGQPA